jgi:hypothetical protein
VAQPIRSDHLLSALKFPSVAMSDEDDDFDIANLDHPFVDVDPQAYEDELLAAAIAASLAEAKALSDARQSTFGSGPSRSNDDSLDFQNTNKNSKLNSDKSVLSVISDSSSDDSPTTSPPKSAQSYPNETAPTTLDVVERHSTSFLSERAQLEKQRIERQQALKRHREENCQGGSQASGSGLSRSVVERPTKIMYVVWTLRGYPL